MRPIGVLVPPPGLDGLAAAFAYETTGRELVAALKFRHRRAGLPWVGRVLATLLERLDARPAAITWAPTTTANRRRRGYDQAKLLAAALGAEVATPPRATLVRIGDATQTGRPRRDRLVGPRFDAIAPSPRAVVVVDDVLTTGATLVAAARTLRSAGATWVVGITLAATPHPALKSPAGPADRIDEAGPSKENPGGTSGGPRGGKGGSTVQPTEIQVQRSLHALQGDGFGTDHGATATLVDVASTQAEVPVGLVDLLVEVPAVRLERVADARMRLVAGEQPTDDDLAGRMVGRLVCDRLR